MVKGVRGVRVVKGNVIEIINKGERGFDCERSGEREEHCWEGYTVEGMTRASPTTRPPARASGKLRPGA